MGWLIFGCAAAVLLIVCAGIFALAWGVDRSFFGKRYEGDPRFKYFTADDFDGLETEPVEFASGNNTLRGCIYRCAEAPRALVIFVHGFGAGHLAYTTEICTLARAGFCVLAYDATGCGKSDGKDMRGFDQGPRDLSAALRFARSETRFAGMPVLLVGHSWGAFTVLNTLPQCEGVVCGAVAMCGFISCADSLARSMAMRYKILSPLRLPVACCLRLIQAARFRKDANHNSLRALAQTDIPVLLLYGERDAVIPYPANGAVIAKRFAQKSSVSFQSFPAKGHNVYLSERAERLMHEQIGAAEKGAHADSAHAQAYFAAIDWKAITEEDAAVMEQIVRFLYGCAGKGE